MYNISKYIVAQELDPENILLYSTLSTSIITLENEIYNEIFKQNSFENKEICETLCEMGFLFEGEPNAQANKLQEIRQSIVDAGNGITSITLAPTMDCNARCYYCFEHGAQQGKMTMETAEAVTDFLIENCVEKDLTLAWFGGEPLMAVDIIDYINGRLVDANIKIDASITTNGILISDEIIAKFKDWSVSRVQITLDGLGEKYNKIKNYILPLKNPFETIIDNIKRTIASGITVHLRVNYKSTDYDSVKETLDYLHNEFGDNDKLYLYGAPLELPKLKGFSEFDELEGDIFLKVLKYSLERGYENDEINFRDLMASEDYNVALGELMIAPFPAPCYMVNKNKYVIDDKGYLYKCQRHLGHSNMNCGNVFDGIDKNKYYHYYSTAEIHDPECVNCNMFPLCQGGCNSNRLLYGDKFSCPPSKTIINKLVLEYYKYLENDNSFLRR